MCSVHFAGNPAAGQQRRFVPSQLLSEQMLILLILLISLSYAFAMDRRIDHAQSTANIPELEFVALHDLYNFTNGVEWEWSNTGGIPWEFIPDANPCTDNWQGINCTFSYPYEFYHVVVVDLDKHSLTGSLPDTLSFLTELVYLGLDRNIITGSFPPGITNLPNLTTLSLGGNYLWGTIPASLSNLSKLVVLDLYNNYFSGILPSELSELQNLTELRFDANLLSGPLPPSFGLLTKLQLLNGQGNFLSQTFPSSIGNLSNLRELYMKENQFTGTVPETIGNLHKLVALELAHNHMSGTLPAILCGLLELEGVAMYLNQFTGSIPAALGNLQNLLYFEVSYNRLTGSIPKSITTIAVLSQVFLFYNYLTGTIPENLGAMASLNTLSVFGNHLTGTLPPSIAKLDSLQIFLVNNNHLAGNLDNVFDPSYQQSLETVILNNNQFTGSVPLYLFHSRSLKSFVAVSNCFHGELDDQLCVGKSLITLVLDGLSSATSCRKLLTPGLSSSYVTAHPVHGSIPTCLFQLSNISILHMSGNAFSGALPGNLVLSDSLFDLTLSHNLLTGKIPAPIQQRKWYNLDASFNRFSGTIENDFAMKSFNSTYVAKAKTQVQEYFLEYFNISDFHLNATKFHHRNHRQFSLENNRLSGKIPQSAQDLPVISMLGTNMFSCELNGDGLPRHDPDRRKYQCGSSAFDIPYYIWLAVSGGTLAFLAVVYLWRKRDEINSLIASANKWMNFFSTCMPRKLGLASFDQFVTKTTRFALCVVAIVLFCYLPLYCVLNSYFHMLTYEYTWFASAAYLSGVAPAAVLISLWSLLLCGVICCAARYCGSPSSDERSISSSSSASVLASMLAPPRTVLSVYFVYILINLVVVVGANAAYVYVYIYQSAELQLFAQVLLSFFKLIWNNACTPLVLRFATRLDSRCSVAENGTRLKTHVSSYVTLQVCVALLNNIVIPCLVVAFVSPSCFYHVFVAAPAITSTFVYTTCKAVTADGTCTAYTFDTDSTFYDPPFTYSYQCSASMITYYAPAFVILCFVSTFVAPVLQLCLCRAYSRATQETIWFKLFDRLLPPILKDPVADPREQEEEEEEVQAVPLYNLSQMYATTITFIGLMLTFGAVFPPLAISLCLAVLVNAYFSKLKVGRFLCAAVEQKVPFMVDRIDQHCQAVGSVPLLLLNSTWMVVAIASLFYTLFLFDALGDAAGLEDALWVLIVMPLLPLCLYFLQFIVSGRKEPFRLRQHSQRSTSEFSENSVANPISFVEQKVESDIL